MSYFMASKKIGSAYFTAIPSTTLCELIPAEKRLSQFEGCFRKLMEKL
jgi:hypothetical protein